MNWAKKNREKLAVKNYVLKANAASNYWFGLSKQKVQAYLKKIGYDFNIILYGDENLEAEFYTFPYSSIADLLTEENLYLANKRQRWVGDITNHVLHIRNSKRERNLREYFSIPVSLSTFTASLNTEEKNDYAIENAKRELLIRIKQSVFRKKVLQNFQSRCCLSGISEVSLLVASHIVPWSVNVNTRLSPHNGLCFSVLYDKLFDTGYFSLDDKLKVFVTKKLNLLSLPLQKALIEIDGRAISSPVKYNIDLEFIESHRKNVFENF